MVGRSALEGQQFMYMPHPTRVGVLHILHQALLNDVFEHFCFHEALL